MTQRFTTDNTEGYTAAQLAELNRRLEARLHGLTADERGEKALTDAIGEKVLAEFDAE